MSRRRDGAGVGLTRRQFGAAAVAVAGTVGYAGAASTQPQESVVERDGWQVAAVQVERQFTFVGASAILYNEGGSRATATIRFRLYRPNGRLEFERTVDVAVPGGEERHVATWWERDRPGTTTPEIAAADAEIVGVQG